MNVVERVSAIEEEVVMALMRRTRTEPEWPAWPELLEIRFPVTTGDAATHKIPVSRG